MSVAGKTVANYPLLLSEWHPVRNAPLSPGEVSAGSNKKVWWRCALAHEFHSSPNGRTNNRRRTGGSAGCPICRAARRWTWERITTTARGVRQREGHLPAAAWFQGHGLAMLVQSVYQSGQTWMDLRLELEAFDGCPFVESRSGIRWQSYAEAGLSNFLFARGIPHGKGRKYPPEYATFSGRNYGYFDLWLEAKDGRRVDVEVWGDKPHGHGEARYARKRRIKEEFNRGRSDFLGVHFTDCTDDRRLTVILEPFIGNVAAHVFVKPHDAVVETSHWANVDELLESCRALAAQQPDGRMPTEGWLRKRGRHAKRPGPAYNTVSIYIKLWAGGMRRVRDLLGQPQYSTVAWTRASALAEFKGWWDRYGRSPGAVRGAVDHSKMRMSADELRRGGRIQAAVDEYVGGAIAACEALGIKPSRSRRRGCQATADAIPVKRAKPPPPG